MTSGAAVAPSSAFAPCFAAVPDPQPAFDLGFARSSLNDDASVRELRAGSNAARAGLRDGDKVLDYTDLKELTADPAARMTLRVRRANAERTITYLPRGAAVENYRFVDVPTAPDAACRF